MRESLWVPATSATHPSSLVWFVAPLISFVSIVRVNPARWTPPAWIHIPFTNPKFLSLNESQDLEDSVFLVCIQYCHCSAVCTASASRQYALILVMLSGVIHQWLQLRIPPWTLQHHAKMTFLCGQNSIKCCWHFRAGGNCSGTDGDNEAVAEAEAMQQQREQN